MASSSSPPGDDEITRLLDELRQGCAQAEAKLIPLVYDELRRLARIQMASERFDHTLQATALVHEAYIKLVASKRIEWTDRAHFFAVAAEMMRQILVDHARKRAAQKRGSAGVKVVLEDGMAISDADLERILCVDEALRRLKSIDARQAQVVVLRFFAGLDYAEIAETLGIAERMAKRDWKHAQAWLYGEVQGS